jgi:hypothetical protein
MLTVSRFNLFYQNDFHEGGSLAVPGSTKQAVEISKMIMYDNLLSHRMYLEYLFFPSGFVHSYHIRQNKDKIGEIFVTLDSHHKKHIAHKSFWSSIENDVNFKGKEPDAFSTITAKNLRDGEWFPKDCSLQVWLSTKLSLNLYYH